MMETVRSFSVLNSNNDCNWNNPAQGENRNWDGQQFVLQSDAIYDYERVPVEWNAFDEQPTVYQYGDASVWRDTLDEDDSKLAS
jgi:hypothetical protein